MPYDNPKCKQCGQEIAFVERTDGDAEHKWLVVDPASSERVLAGWAQGADGRNRLQGRKVSIYKQHDCPARKDHT